MRTRSCSTSTSASGPVATSLVRNHGSQRRCACGKPIVAGGECAECRRRRLQRAAGGAQAAARDGLQSPGRPLDEATRRFMEEGFAANFTQTPARSAPGAPRLLPPAETGGDPAERQAEATAHRVVEGRGASSTAPRREPPDFSRVRVHTDGGAARSARSLEAQAFTAGEHIVFGAGHYAPGTDAGRRLLAHELTHVLQQGPAPQPARVQRRIEVQNPGDATPNPPGGAAMTNAEIVESWIDTLCPDGNWEVDGTSGEVSSPDRADFCGARPNDDNPHFSTSGTPTSCECICDLTAAGSLEVQVHAANFVALPSGPFDINASGEGRHRRPDPPGRPHSTVGVSGREHVGVEGAGDTSPHSGTGRDQVLRDPPWIILGHEMCGHALRASRSHGMTPEGDITAVDVENRIRREHSTLADNLGIRKGVFTDAAGGGHEGSTYEVSRGETLSGIAVRVGIPVADMLNHIFRENGDAITVATQNTLATGERLLIEDVFWHEVIRGETMSSIATMWDIPLASLIRANPGISDPNLIRIGQRILVPAS